MSSARMFCSSAHTRVAIAETPAITNMAVNAPFIKHLLLFFFVVGACKESHGDLTQFGCGFDISHYRLARYRRHLHIQQDEIRHFVARVFDRLSRIQQADDFDFSEARKLHERVDLSPKKRTSGSWRIADLSSDSK